MIAARSSPQVRRGSDAGSVLSSGVVDFFSHQALVECIYLYLHATQKAIMLKKNHHVEESKNEV